MLSTEPDRQLGRRTEHLQRIFQNLDYYFAPFCGCSHSKNADGDQNKEKHSARVAVVSDSKSFEQVFSKDESIWV